MGAAILNLGEDASGGDCMPMKVISTRTTRSRSPWPTTTLYNLCVIHVSFIDEHCRVQIMSESDSYIQEMAVLLNAFVACC